LTPLKLSIDDLNTNAITRAALMFVNLKINKIKTILISCSQITLKEEEKTKINTNFEINLH